MVQIMFLIAAAVVGLGFLWFLRTPPARLAGQLRVLAIVALGVIAFFLLMRGQLGLALTFSTLALGIMLRPNKARQPDFSGRRTEKTSQVRTAYLEMELDTESGAIYGRVLKGAFAGRDITSMAPSELALLWQDCRFEDPQSAQIVETYLDRIHPSWREDVAHARPETDSGRMTTDEAYDILGLKPGASEQDVRQAHRNLMKKMHPDRGGSSYLAAKINQAKDLLLQNL